MKIVYNNLYQEVGSRITTAQESVKVYSPYMKLSTLKEISKDILYDVKISLYIRLTLKDLSFGSVDIGVLKYALDNNISLYINNSLHMKAYVYDESCMHIGSANCTGRGLGLSSHPNFELLTLIDDIPHNFHTYCNRIQHHSKLLTPLMYKKIITKLDEINIDKQRVEELVSLEESFGEIVDSECQILASQLPRIETIKSFYEQYRNGVQDDRVLNTLDIYGIKDTDVLSFDHFKERLYYQFMNEDFSKFIFNSFSETINFGKVRMLLEKNCIDDPRPGREKVDELINNFFNWLQELGGLNYSIIQPNYTKIIKKNKDLL